MRVSLLVCFAAIGILAFVAGCGELSRIVGSTWHAKCGWKAGDYFDDPQVIALCEAIEANDLAEIDRLVAAGADVNADGKGKMTPLLWAFPDSKLGRFERLLEHGADPNVVIESDFNTRGGMSAGDSVTHMACKTKFPGYFEAVFKHGGDVNLQQTSGTGRHDTPLLSVIKSGSSNKEQMIRTLLDGGADINYVNKSNINALIYAASWGAQYRIAIYLLENGANFKVSRARSNTRLIHIVVGQERRSTAWTPQQRSDYERLVKWLEDHGESVEEARADIERWRSWSMSTGEYRRKMNAEISQRKLREAREKAEPREREGGSTEP